MTLHIQTNGELSFAGTVVQGEPWSHQAESAYLALGVGGVLCALVTAQLGSKPRPDLVFWQELSAACLRSFCLEPQTQYPSGEIVERFLGNAPPVNSLATLDPHVIRQAWQSMHKVLREGVEAFDGDRSAYLARYFPGWQDHGSLHLYLAESKPGSPHPFGLLCTFALRLAGRAQTTQVSLGVYFADHCTDPREQQRTMEPFRLAAQNSVFVRDALAHDWLRKPCYLDSHQTYQLLSDAEKVQESGVQLHLPNSWQQKPPAKAQVTLVQEEKQSYVGLHQLLGFRPQVRVDGVALAEEKLRHLLAGKPRLVQIDGRWVQTGGEALENLLQRFVGAQHLKGHYEHLSFALALRLLAGAGRTEIELQEDGEADDLRHQPQIEFNSGFTKILRELCRPQLDSEQEKIINYNLKAQLRPYQAKGVSWLCQLAGLGCGGILADDMGLGKTLQVIASWLLLKHSSVGECATHLLLTPTSLMANWIEELRRFAPQLKVIGLHRSLLEGANPADYSEQDLRQFDIVITSHGMLGRLPVLSQACFATMVVDEAQAAKNHQSQLHGYLLQVQRSSTWLLTGTPVENGLEDLWSLCELSVPGLLGSASAFQRYSRSDHQGYSKLRQLLQPFMLRRLKTDKAIIKDLPPKIIRHRYCSLSQVQEKAYRSVLDKLKTDLNQPQDQKQRRGMVLSYLSQLKQILNHPDQWRGQGDFLIHHSGKLQMLLEIAAGIHARGERLLVFSQYRQLTEVLARILRERLGCEGLVLHGQTPSQKRQQLVNQFQKNSRYGFMVLSLKAAGVGLNLVAANHVIHFDRWWNPAVENQATDRAFRIGQIRTVQVHNLICRGTLEDKIHAMMASKSQLSGEVLSGSPREMDLAVLNDNELIGILSLDGGEGS